VTVEKPGGGSEVMSVHGIPQVRPVPGLASAGCQLRPAPERGLNRYQRFVEHTNTVASTK